MVKFKTRTLLFLASIFFILTCTGSVYAEDSPNLESSPNIIYVNSSGHDSNNGTSWQLAKQTIQNATGTVANGGTVNIANGDYKDSKDIKIVINKNITIAGQSELNTIIDADGNGYIFSINEVCTVVLKNLTLKNGKSDNGGAINNQGKLTIESCSINNNHVDIDSNVGYGGAIYNSGTLNITSCDIYSNHAADGDSSHHDGRDGGAIYNTGTLTIANSNIYKNHAGNGNAPGTGSDIGSGGNGGSIFNTATGNLIITHCSFSNNTAGTGGDATPKANAKDGGSGGGIYSNGNLTITNCTFTENSAGDGGDNPGVPGSWGASGGSGGAIYINQGTANITDSSFDDNNAGGGHHGGYGGYGGGIYNNGVLILQSSEMTKNDAGNGGSSKDSKPARQGGFGGAIFNQNTLNILYCTFQSNHAGDGGNSGDNPGGDGGLGRGHAGVVPARDPALLHQREQPALRQHRARDVQARELDLLAVEDAQLVEVPVVEGPVDDVLEAAQRVGDALDRVLERVRVVVQGIDAPRVARAVVGGVPDAVHHRIAHLQVRVRHVDLRPQGPGPVGELSRAHARGTGRGSRPRTCSARGCHARGACR